MRATTARFEAIARFAAVAILLIAPAATIGHTQESWEAKFRASIEPGRIRESMRRLSARPHHVGSPYDRDNAEWILARFREWGWNAEIETFSVLFPTPKERIVELVAPTRFRAALQEPPVAQDPTSAQTDEQLPSYNAYSADGDVTAPLVYVNYGSPTDYEALDRLGVSVKGAIVIARYGATWRGIKPKVAAEHGAVGCIIYSDPRDDGYFSDSVFPDGPMRNKDGVQRGSVSDMVLYPGDPLTPGVAATEAAQRLPIAEARTITKIPTLPISYGDARPLLEALGGQVAPEEWRGGLPITYRVGPGPARVHLKVAANWDLKPLYNVVARIPGATFPDEWIIRGNHHDAWVNGAGDPSSGMAPELEEARAFGELLKQGWRPKRTIVYTAWDGEEPMLLGSTEWVEKHEEDLKKAVVYINSDGNSRGYLNAGGSHALEHFVNGVARDIKDPESGQSVWKRMQARQIANGTPEARTEARDRADLRIGALGSGSDYSPFLQHAGTPTLSLSYGGEDDDGVYHSVYDDFYHYTKFSDGEFIYGRALAETMGTTVIRLADATLLPFEFTNLADTVSRYVKELQDLLHKRQTDIKEQNRQIDDGIYEAIRDPRRPEVAPKKKDVPPALNFAPLENASNQLTQAAARYKKAADAAREALNQSPAAAASSINQKLIQSERALTDPSGLPGRPWYRHLLYAPGTYTGYGVKTVPGVREGIEQERYEEAEREAVRVATALKREAELIDQASAELEGIKR
ncbi:MAG TPA: transferrin receptor-like dimerization domain-containing protein [Vicinamibacterales bacterium]|nr:transferrin receptor-like dimerization domain-containing protein [Vicinamibacterales bacterium]